jgi:hypothetical protein
MSNTNVEINLRSVADTEDGKEIWDVEVITDNNDLWTLKEPLHTESMSNPDREKIEKDFFVNRHLFELLGNYYIVKEKQRLEAKEQKRYEQEEFERVQREVREREAKLPQHSFVDNSVLIGQDRIEINNPDNPEANFPPLPTGIKKE